MGAVGHVSVGSRNGAVESTLREGKILRDNHPDRHRDDPPLSPRPALKVNNPYSYYNADTNPVTGLQFTFSSGNIASGQCSLYGLN